MIETCQSEHGYVVIAFGLYVTMNTLLTVGIALTPRQMGQNEELRERRARAEDVNRRSLASLTQGTLATINGHKSSLSSVDTNDSSSPGAEPSQPSMDSPEQSQPVLLSRTSQASSGTRSSSEPRLSRGYRSILN